MATTPDEARAQIVNLVRDFVRREVEPVAADLDREDRVPHDLINQMKELGLFGITVPEEYGGGGTGALGHIVVDEEVRRSIVGLVQVMPIHRAD